MIILFYAYGFHYIWTLCLYIDTYISLVFMHYYKFLGLQFPIHMDSVRLLGMHSYMRTMPVLWFAPPGSHSAPPPRFPVETPAATSGSRTPAVLASFSFEYGTPYYGSHALQLLHQYFTTYPFIFF